MVSLDDYGVDPRSDRLVAASEDARRVAEVPPVHRSTTLARVIETDIIPRLLLASGRAPNGRPASALAVDADDIETFAQIMMRLDLTRAHVIVTQALDRGVMLESVLLDLFAPTAQRLGVMWTEDICSFTDVTVGLCALQSLLRTYASGEFLEPSAMCDGRALICAAPDEQHTFGVLILETFFRRAGWDVVGMPMSTRDEMLACVNRKFFSVVGFSLSRESALPELRDLIGAVRAQSRNPEVVVLVGGRVFNETPETSRAVGADLTAADAGEALVASQNVLCSRTRTH